ncbi:MAG TPA: tripartite tricarboxylate transporter substrate binding protein [Burkholderiales bacterium]
MKRLIVLAALALAALPAAAQQYPSKPIRMVVPFPPSGAADLTARTFVAPLSQALGTQVVLENKAGADGAIAGLDVMKAAPDGYTLLFGTNTGMCAAPALRKTPPYDPIADFTPIALVGKFGFFMFVHESVPAKSVAELIEHAKKNPGKINYGTGNATSILATAQFAQGAGIQLVHIPYKGDAPATIDFVAGRVQLLIGTPGTVLPHVKEGKARVLATLLSARSPLLPDAPTLAEAGQKPMPVQPFGAVYGPAKMPKEIVDKIARAVQAVMAQQAVKDGVARYAFEAQSSTPEELAAFHKVQFDVWKRSAKELNLQVD